MDARSLCGAADRRGFLRIVALCCSAWPAALTAGEPPAVLFSEYVEGSSSSRALEIFNPSAVTVNLAAGEYLVQLYFNGSLTPGAPIALTGVVPSGGTWVLVDSSAVAELLALADQTSPLLDFNGNDAVVLRVNGAGGTVIDSVGRVGEDPGSAWTNGGISTADQTLRRREELCLGDTNVGDAYNPAIDWLSFLQNDFSGLGAHTSTCAAYVFADGFEGGDMSRWSAAVPIEGEGVFSPQ